jgi:hypothetical protein
MRFFKLALGALAFLSSDVFAINCPNPSEFTHHFRLPPIAYDAKTHQVKQVAVSFDKNGHWIMLMHPVLSSPEQTNNQFLNDIINQLIQVSPTSYQSVILDSDDPVDYCVYTNPTLPKLNAMAYYIEDDLSKNLNGAIVLKSAKLQALLKQFPAA